MVASEIPKEIRKLLSEMKIRPDGFGQFGFEGQAILLKPCTSLITFLHFVILSKVGLKYRTHKS